MHRSIACLAAFACLLLAVAPGYAQDDQQTQGLPDIAPRVVEIRGNLELSLPSLQRQPLVGFNPPPSVAPIPPDRRPFVEDYKQESVDLPASSLGRPEPPAVASLIGGTPLNGSLEATGGRYLSRSARFRSEWSMTNAAAVYSRLDYEGSDGHEPAGADEDVTSSFNALDAAVGVQNSSRWATFGLEIDGFVNTYRLYGALPAAGFGEVRDEPPFRDGRGGGAQLWMVTQATTGTDIDIRARYGVASYQTDALIADATPASDPFARDETAIEIDSRLVAPLSNRHDLIGDLRFTGLGFDDETIGSDAKMLDGAAGLKIAVGRSLRVAALGRLMTFSESDSVSRFYASPDFVIDLYPTQVLRLYLKNDPRSEHRSTASMYRESPFLVDRPTVQPTIYTVDARAGSRVQAGVFEVDLHAGYSRAPNYRFFERATAAESGGFGRGMVAARYDDAEIRYLGTDASINLPAGFLVTAGVTFRDGTLIEADEEIPYFGPVLARGGLSYSFLEGRGHVQATTTYESARNVDRVGSRQLGDYFDLDIDASYRFADYLGALVRLQNLSSGYLERWENYDQAPFIISAGLRVQW